MPFGICVTETMECMGIDQPERFEEFEPRTAFDFEANPHILRYGPCLDDGSCPMPNGVCLTDIFQCVGVGHLVKVEMEETDKVQESSNMTAALHFQEEILEMPKLDQMETRGAFSLKTEL
ncbi:hypothetical protein L596_020609 [Steinernema carpocapsae]|nr:hypothetical protein L596_020609 [Steinernema carpocapsae]